MWGDDSTLKRHAISIELENFKFPPIAKDTMYRNIHPKFAIIKITCCVKDLLVSSDISTIQDNTNHQLLQLLGQYISSSDCHLPLYFNEENCTVIQNLKLVLDSPSTRNSPLHIGFRCIEYC